MTNTTDLTDSAGTTGPTEIIDIYLAAYGEPDAASRAELIARAFTPDAELADPPFAAAGHDELSASFAAVQAQFPGHHFARSSTVDHHHDVARYGWALLSATGETALTGLDVATFGPDGRIVRVSGSIGDLEPVG